MKKNKKSKDIKPSKKTKQAGSSKDTTQSQPKSTGKSMQAEETVFEAVDINLPMDQGENIGNADEQPNDEAAPKKNKSRWFKQPPGPPTPDPEWNKGKSVKDGPLTKLTKANVVGPVYNLLKGTCKSCIELEYNMEECYRALSDKLDWNNPKGDRCPYEFTKPLPLHGSSGDFPRLHLNDIENMLLLHVQNKLFNLEGDVIVDLAVALRMFTRRIVIQKRVKDLQLGGLGKDSVLKDCFFSRFFHGIKECFREPQHLRTPPSETAYALHKVEVFFFPPVTLLLERKHKIKRSMKVPVVSNTIADISRNEYSWRKYRHEPIKVEEALAHSYLERLHDNDDEPICPNPFCFDFEQQVAVTLLLKWAVATNKCNVLHSMWKVQSLITLSANFMSIF
ncbi:hypothetical protein Tco_0909422 [Tanacetum coccineum]|uniref:Uncharacterized protein n=1 Tax=Tanacetum coccineum TaxID=301880 RepID=A0ABQ5CSR2_9ASTR